MHEDYYRAMIYVLAVPALKDDKILIYCSGVRNL